MSSIGAKLTHPQPNTISVRFILRKITFLNIVIVQDSCDQIVPVALNFRADARHRPSKLGNISKNQPKKITYSKFPIGFQTGNSACMNLDSKVIIFCSKCHTKDSASFPPGLRVQEVRGQCELKRQSKKVPFLEECILYTCLCRTRQTSH